MTVFSLARNTISASLPAARSIKYTASPCRLASAAFLTFSVGPNFFHRICFPIQNCFSFALSSRGVVTRKKVMTEIIPFLTSGETNLIQVMLA
jgi:hypothetical protein